MSTDPPPDRKTARGLDPELQAMAKLDRTLAGLAPDAKQRVLMWLVGKHAGPGFVARVEAPAPRPGPPAAPKDFFDHAGP